MFQIYKSGQAKLLRLFFAFLAEAFIIYGCYQLYLWLNFTDPTGNPRWIASQIAYSQGLEMEITPRLIISVGAFFFFTLSNYLISNSQRFSDFLIDVHTELTKVSWPTREEVIKSSAVVLLLTVILTGYIYVWDLVFTKIVSLIL